MTDLFHDDVTLSRLNAAPLPVQRGPVDLGRRHARAVTPPPAVHAADRVSVSPQARLRAGQSAELKVARTAPVAHSQPRVSLERLERIKRFYAAGNMRPNPQAIARHLWHERHGL
jgi:hypothetical protein